MYQKQKQIQIETFLDARANDSDSFDFTPPGEVLLHLNLFVKHGLNQYLMSIELQFKQHLDKYLNHEH